MYLLTQIFMLHQKCEYTVPHVSSLSSTAASSPTTELFLGSGVCTSSSLKDAIMQKFGPHIIEESLSAYHREVEPWFPIISIPRLQSRLAQTGEGFPLEVAVLCVSIILLTTPPPPCLDNDNDLVEFKLLYFHVKRLISSTEALGLNSFHIIQSRILVTLYEIAHGLYPAAYLSIGAAISAADALVVYPGVGPQSPHIPDAETKREDSVLIWCGILVLDRYALLRLNAHVPTISQSSPMLISFQLHSCRVRPSSIPDSFKNFDAPGSSQASSVPNALPPRPNESHLAISSARGSL